MAIEENQLAKEWRISRATYINILWMDVYGVNCLLKVLKWDGPTLFIAQIPFILVALKLNDLEPLACK